MKTAYDVIIRPIITEQSMEDLDIKKYAFEVAEAQRCLSDGPSGFLEESGC